MMVRASYFDGETARPIPVDVEIEPGALVLTPEAGEAIRWPLETMRRISHGEHDAESSDFVRDWASTGRLRVDDPALIAELRRAVPDLDKPRPASRPAVRRAFIWAGAAVGALAFIIFVAIPALAPRIAKLIPAEREIAFGEEVDNLLQQIGLHSGTCNNEAGDAALAKMTARLSDGLDLRIPLDVSVVKSNVVNAVALPGGRVLLFSPLLQQAEGPGEVAGVLAHEIGHVQEAHPTREAIRASAATAVIGLIFGDFAGAGVLALAGDRFINTSYTRDAERDADEFAIERLTHAELSVRPLADFMARFREKGHDASMFGGWFATHPSFAEREARLKEIEVAAAEPVLSDAEWQALRSICKTE